MKKHRFRSPRNERSGSAPRWFSGQRSHVALPAILLLTLLLSVPSCAYNYAGQEGKTRQEPAKESKVEVVEFKEGEPEPAPPAEEAESSEEQAESESPCGVRTFQIHYYNATSRITKTVDCVDRQVIHVERTPMGETFYQDARASNLPEDTWYLLVDPRGIKSTHLGNDALLKLSREFTIDFFGRDAGNEYLIYVYEDTIK